MVKKLAPGCVNLPPAARVRQDAGSRNLRPAFLRDDCIKFVPTSRVHCVYCKPNNLRQALIHNRFIHSRCLGDLLPIRSLSTVLSVKPEAADLGDTVMDFSYFSALTDLVVYVDFTYCFQITRGNFKLPDTNARTCFSACEREEADGTSGK